MYFNVNSIPAMLRGQLGGLRLAGSGLGLLGLAPLHTEPSRLPRHNIFFYGNSLFSDPLRKRNSSQFNG